MPEFFVLPRPDGSSATFKRVGSCQPEKCGAACCRALVLAASSRDDALLLSLSGFRKVAATDPAGNVREFHVGPRQCKMLSEGKCRAYKERPMACARYPSPDSAWLAVKDVCTYGFEEVK